MHLQELTDAGGDERPSAGKQLPGDQRQRILVSTTIDGKARGLLRRGVGGGPAERPTCLATEFGRQAEVEDLEVALVGRLDVRWLQVSVYHEPRVGELERLGQRPDDQPDLLQREATSLLDHVVQRRAGYVLENGERGLAVVTEVMDRRDGRVCQVGPDLGLLEEPVLELLLGGLASSSPAALAGEDRLDGHGAVEPVVATQEDQAHGAAAELSLQHVTTLQDHPRGEGADQLFEILRAQQWLDPTPLPGHGIRQRYIGVGVGSHGFVRPRRTVRARGRWRTVGVRAPAVSSRRLGGCRGVRRTGPLPDTCRRADLLERLRDSGMFQDPVGDPFATTTVLAGGTHVRGPHRVAKVLAFQQPLGRLGERFHSQPYLEAGNRPGDGVVRPGRRIARPESMRSEHDANLA